MVNRGVAAWKGRIYVGTLDGRLVALDAGTGKPDWSVQTTPKDRPYTITGAPRVVDGKVVIGNEGEAEYGVREHITAYDAETGDQAWRFYTVPGNPDDPIEGEHLQAAMSSWRGGEWWKVGGGGTVWDSMAYDPQLNLQPHIESVMVRLGIATSGARAAGITCICPPSLRSIPTTAAWSGITRRHRRTTGITPLPST